MNDGCGVKTFLQSHIARVGDVAQTEMFKAMLNRTYRLNTTTRCIEPKRVNVSPHPANLTTSHKEAVPTGSSAPRKRH